MKLVLVGGGAVVLLLATLSVPLLFFNTAAAGSCGGSGTIDGHAVPSALEAAARRAAQQTGVDELALLAVTYRETQWGQSRAGVPDDVALAWIGDLAPAIDRAALAPGGVVAAMVGRPDGIRLGDWANPTAVGDEHAIGFAQFLPSTWRSVAAAHPRPGGPAWNPYSPADAMTLAGYYLKALMNSTGGDAGAAAQRYGTTDFQSAYDELKATWRETCLTGFSVGDPFGGRCHPVTLQVYGAVEVFTPDHRHHGIDIACQEGAPIFSVTGGEAYNVASGCANGARDTCGAGYGNHVVVRFHGRVPGDTTDHDYYVIYGHLLQAPTVSRGQPVQPRVQLGLQGDSGLSWGSHLHFEVDRDAWQTLKSIDPSPFLPSSISRTATA